MKIIDIKKTQAKAGQGIKKETKKKWSAAKIINIILIVAVFFSIVHIVTAVTPNPGHSWAETGDGTFQVIGPTALRTYTFPDADATIFTGAETDPVYTAWNKTTGISITESQISDLQAYLLAEVDPVFTAWDKTTGISITESQISDLQAYLTSYTETDPVFLAQKGAANGVATLGADSKIPSAQLPLITISNTYVVADEAEMLALTAEIGDVAVRTDLSESYICASNDCDLAGDWQQLLTPTDTVLSVNGATGAVVLTTTNIGEGTNLYFTDAKAIAAPLTGYVSGAGVVADTDTILQAIQKLNGNIGAIDLSGYLQDNVGIAGGSTLIGGTLTTEGLTLRANSADTTTGTINITTSTSSTTSATGALTVAGGVGIGRAINQSGGSVWFDGTTGATPTSGAGTRLMWIPAKGAFRAGLVSGVQWDDANIGNYSVAFGVNTTAASDFGFASGYLVSVGSGTFAHGYILNSTAPYSAAFGNGNSSGGVVII